MSVQLSLIFLYGFSTSLESNLTNVIKIIKNALNQKAQVSFVFIQDGVIGTSYKNQVSSAMAELLKMPLTFYAMIPDLKARGFDSENLQNNIEGIEYEDLVDLLAITSKIVSWM